VVAGDQTDVAPTDDEQAFGRPDEVPVSQGLEGAGAVNAGKRIAWEGKVLLTGSGGDEEYFGFDQEIFMSVPDHADFFVAEYGQGGSLKPDLDAGKRAYFLFQFGGNVDASRSGIYRFVRSEEPVGLENKLAAEAMLVVDHYGLDIPLAQLDSRRKPGRAAADDQNGCLDGFYITKTGWSFSS